MIVVEREGTYRAFEPYVIKLHVPTSEDHTILRGFVKKIRATLPIAERGNYDEILTKLEVVLDLHGEKG